MTVALIEAPQSLIRWHYLGWALAAIAVMIAAIGSIISGSSTSYTCSPDFSGPVLIYSWDLYLAPSCGGWKSGSPRNCATSGSSHPVSNAGARNHCRHHGLVPRGPSSVTQRFLGQITAGSPRRLYWLR